MHLSPSLLDKVGKNIGEREASVLEGICAVDMGATDKGMEHGWRILPTGIEERKIWHDGTQHRQIDTTVNQLLGRDTKVGYLVVVVCWT